MKDTNTIDDYCTKASTIVNQLITLCEELNDNKVVERF